MQTVTYGMDEQRGPTVSNQSILKEISPGISLEGMMLKLKLQYFGHLLRRVDSLDETPGSLEWNTEGPSPTSSEPHLPS